MNREENSSPKHLVIAPSSQSDAKFTAEDTKLILFAVLFIGGLFSAPVVIFYLICAIIKDTKNYFKAKKEAKRREFLLNRSQHNYQGDDKLFPNNFLFIDNDSWTRDLLDDFWHDLYLEKSNYYYEGSDKLYPDNFDFVENKTWTKELTVAYYKEKEEKKKREEEAKLATQRRDYEDRLNRSRHDYSGPRKLYPKDANFVKNDTWTETLLYAYIAQQAAMESSTKSSHSSSNAHHDHDSSSSWDSSNWSGGGFDGGGASGSW